MFFSSIFYVSHLQMEPPLRSLPQLPPTSAPTLSSVMSYSFSLTGYVIIWSQTQVTPLLIICSPTPLDHKQSLCRSHSLVKLMLWIWVSRCFAFPRRGKLQRRGSQIQEREKKKKPVDNMLCWQDCGEIRLSHLAGESAKQCLQRICLCLAKMSLVQQSNNSTCKMDSIGKYEVMCIWNSRRLEITPDVHQ